MRVTMFIRCLAMMRGGGETRHLAWIRELSLLGVEVDVVTGHPLIGAPRHALSGMPTTIVRSPYTRDAVYRWQNRRGFGRLTMAALHADEEWFCRAAWRRVAAKRVAPDVVHAHALYQTARLRRAGVPVVINLPGEPHPRYTADLGQADALVADGWAADHLPARLGKPVDRIVKGVDASLFQPQGPNRRAELGLAHKQVVLAVSRLVPLKNLAMLIDAIAMVKSTHPAVQLVVVGEGPEREALGQRAFERGVGDAVTWIGYAPQTDTPCYYRSADVFALSSDFDNSPNAVLEAMACGLPVVSTDVGGVAAFVDGDRGGALVPKGDSRTFADALRSMFDGPQRARQFGEFNRHRALTAFSWRASARQLLDVYERVVAERGTARMSA